MNPTDAPPFLSSIGAPWPVRALTVTIRYDSTLGFAAVMTCWGPDGRFEDSNNVATDRSPTLEEAFQALREEAKK